MGRFVSAVNLAPFAYWATRLFFNMAVFRVRTIIEAISNRACYSAQYSRNWVCPLHLWFMLNGALAGVFAV